MKISESSGLENIPKVSLFSILRFGFLFRSNPIEAFVRLARKKGDLFRLSLFGQYLYFVNRPECIKQVLSDNYTNYPRAHTLEPFSDLLGDGLFKADDDIWQKTRPFIEPAFHKQNVEGAFQTIISETAEFFDTQIAIKDRTAVVNIELEMKRLALRISTKILLSPRLEINADPIIDALADIMEAADISHQTRRKMRVAISRKFPMQRQKSRIVADGEEYIHGLVEHIIEEFFAPNAERGYFLETLYRAYKKNEVTIDRVITETINLFFTGFDPVAEALTWTLFAIDKTPGLRKKLEEEVDGVFPDGQLTYHGISNLPLLEQVIKESLRLYPPVWSLHRIALREDILGNVLIPRNAWIMICPFALHRDPELWPEPAAFKPERFANDKNSFSRYDYLPFGNGPHSCIGQEMAFYEIAIVMAMLLQRYRISFRIRTKPLFKSTAVLQAKELMLNNISRRVDSKVL